MRLSVLLLFLSVAAYAKPPPGTDMTSAEHAWWECFHQNNGISCCSVADGHVLASDDWREDPKHAGIYEVRLQGVWMDVPPQAVIKRADGCGPEPNIDHQMEAKIWYAPQNDVNGRLTGAIIYCFMAGVMY